MLLTAQFKQHKLPALFFALVTALLFVLSPVTSVAHALQAHTTQSSQDQGSSDSSGNICDLCIGLAAGASAASADAPQFFSLTFTHDTPRAAPIGLLRPIAFAAYASRAPPYVSFR